MADNENSNSPGEGLRERKRRETLKRIVDKAVRLFIQNGYEATTLAEIAAEAGISRRTFFYYFKSKDDILLSLQSGIGDMLATALRDIPPDRRPIDAAQEAVIRVCASYPADDMMAIDRLMRSSEAVQARKQASYIQHEKTFFDALRARWPQREDETALRLVSMLSIGALRLSLEAMSREGGKRPLVDLLNEAFAALKSEI